MAETTIPTLDPKDPDEVLDYTWDFTLLLETAESIASIDATTVSPTTTTPLVVDSSAVTGSGKKVTLWLSGGEKCNQYAVAVKVTTDATTPRTFERSCIIPVEER